MDNAIRNLFAHKYLSFRRITSRFKENQRRFSFGVALGKLVRDFPLLSWTYRNNCCIKSERKYLVNRYLPFLQRLTECYRNSELVEGEKKIWVMWWQGADHMPPIVKACYSQLLSVKNEYEVVLITKHNLQQYLELPTYIMNKVDSGAITLTHLSDIIRWGLLYYHGGFYLDIKMYISRFPEIIKHYDFFTLRAPGVWGDTIYSGYWFGPCLSFKQSHTLFSYLMYSLFLKYWEENDALIEYFLTDIFTDLVYSNVPEIKQMVDNVPTNYYFMDLLGVMNSPYDKPILEEVFKKSDIHFLTYKQKFMEYTEDGLPTIYKHLISARSEER